MNDFRLAFRLLLKSPGFTTVAVLSLALGIGANTAVFSLVNAALLRLLPVRAPEELVLFNWLSRGTESPRSTAGWQSSDPETGGTTSTSFSVQIFEAFRAHTTTLDSVFAFAPIFGGVNVNIDGNSEIAGSAAIVSGEYHLGLGVTPALGRLLSPADDRLNAPPVAVISYRYWQRRFGGDPNVVGRSVLVNNTPTTIIGVTPARFAGTMQVGEYTDVTLPFSLATKVGPHPAESRKPDFWWVRIMGRLKPGVTAVQVKADLEGVFQETARGNLSSDRQSGEIDPRSLTLRVESGAQGLVEARREQTRTLHLLLGVVALVLLVACANVANLLLARGAARRREIAVRLSLGASRARIVTQLLIESVLLALIGAAVGIVFASWGRDALLALQPLGTAPADLDASLDLRVLAFTTGVAVITGVLFGLVPALRATRFDLSSEIQAGGRAIGTGSRSLLAKGLMAFQVAISLVLLVGAGLFVRTLHNLQQVDVGFDRERLLLFSLNAVAGGAATDDAAATYDQIAQRLAAVPGVRHVGYSQVPLLARAAWSTGVNIPGDPPRSNVSANANGVAPDFLATLGLPLLAGRGFTAHDTATSPKVAIVNQAFARQAFGESNPLGQRFGFGEATPDVEIVGVVPDAQYHGVKSAPPPTLYLPYAQASGPGGAANFILRLAADPAAILPSVREAVRAFDSTLPIDDVRTQEEQIARLFTQERLFASLCSAFGLLAVVLAGVGLYGLMSYSVLRRTGEIGVRMALGALPRGVLWMIVRESLALVVVGIACGTAVAIGASRLISGMLFGLSSVDPVTYGAVALLLAAIALAACWLPARRAARIDPMTALRTE